MRAITVSRFEDLVIVPTENPTTHRCDGEWWMPLTMTHYNIYGSRVIVPCGFVTNFGSVPKCLRSFVDPMAESMLAYLLHDFLYSKDGPLCTKRDADRAMLDISLMCDQDRYEAYAAYLAVKLFGYRKFRAHDCIVRDVPPEILHRIYADNTYHHNATTLQR